MIIASQHRHQPHPSFDGGAKKHSSRERKAPGDYPRLFRILRAAALLSLSADAVNSASTPLRHRSVCIDAYIASNSTWISRRAFAALASGRLAIRLDNLAQKLAISHAATPRTGARCRG